jgi:hypothetical protein
MAGADETEGSAPPSGAHRWSQRRTWLVWGSAVLVLFVIAGLAGVGKNGAGSNAAGPVTTTSTTASAKHKLVASRVVRKPKTKPATKPASPVSSTTRVPASSTTTAPPPPPPPPPTTTVPLPPPTTTSTGCHPLSAAGNCYRAGQYCSDADHGTYGTDANGNAIVCTDNDGWRWEDA